MPDIFDQLETALRNGIADQEHSNRSAILDIITLLVEPEKFFDIIGDIINTFRYNYYHGDESQKEHVRYVLNYLLGDEIENSRTEQNNNITSK